MTENGVIKMPNMSYCRFENTLGDLQDCYDNLDDTGEGELSDSETKARKRLIEMCCDIACDHGDEVDRNII
jgi:hypothetical protein